MIAGYLRVSTCKQHLTNQKDEIQRCNSRAGTDEAEEGKKKARGGNSSRALWGGGYLLSHPG